MSNAHLPLACLLQGYEEVHVPALKPKPFAEGEKLVGIDELKEWMRPAFAGMKSLNRVQSRVANTALYTGENILLCAPTGAGKTNVAMLTILHEVGGPSSCLLYAAVYVPASQASPVLSGSPVLLFLQSLAAACNAQGVRSIQTQSGAFLYTVAPCM